ncbi:sushi, von Willebrand factor type A, EGF and pentraxin domain-containing protein 1-like [Mya arenaria]|uniref:sushi, von Willebrand factor type A, EGF and pentraxin domain-containing protein 1-like n=1 Tax=Mya arenaria TaxID=6604 RepID=UPI0022E4006E|nr:sushi, von Willebrand factor type A, EGF and pentraxin domain-containing protein 1-like [Mya arenaria]
MNGIVTQPDPAYNALEATFSCLPNYWLSGENVLVCLVSGEWNSDSPTCQPNCPMLTPPANSLVIHSGLTPGSTATYVCNPLYTLAGSSTRECSETSMWSGLEPSCLGDCPTLTALEHGGITYTDNLAFGSIATYTCSPGYKLWYGSENRECLQDSTWSGSIPTCIAECEEIDVPDNMRVSYSEDGSVVTFSCRNGYRLVGPESSTCSDNSWDGQQPLCLKECTLRNIPHAMVSGPYPPYVGQSITVDCSDRYSLVGPSQLVCTSDGTFDKDDSISCVRSCEPLTAPTNGMIDSEGFYAVRETRFYCNDGYLLAGVSDRLLCTASGKYNHDPPTCVPDVSPPEMFVAVPKVCAVIFKPGSSTADMKAVIEKDVLQGVSVLGNITIDEISVSNRGNGSHYFCFVLSKATLDDDIVTDIGKSFKDLLNTTSNKPAFLASTMRFEGMPEFDYGANKAVPITSSCFWLQYRENCVDKDKCIEEDNQQLCLCEETPCGEPMEFGIFAIPFVGFFIMCILCFGGCYTHCDWRKRPYKNFDEEESASSYTPAVVFPSILPRLNKINTTTTVIQEEVETFEPLHVIEEIPASEERF